MSIGSAIKSLRQGLDLSQQQLADLTGLKASQIRTIENGGRRKRGSELKAIATALQTDIETLTAIGEREELSAVSEGDDN